MKRLLIVLVAINLMLLAALAIGQPAGTQDASANAAAERGIIAITARNRTGDEVLYLLDPDQKQLLAYEMRPKGLKIVAARRLDFDFKIISYRDGNERDFTYEELKKRFTQPKKKKKGAKPKPN